MESTVVDFNTRLAAALAEQEAIIERYDAGFLAKGRALTVIRDGKLYQLQHKTFEAYCKVRLEMTDRNARYLIEAAAFAEKVEQLFRPVRESHIRPLLTRLEKDEDRLTVWRKVLAAAGGNPRNVKADAIEKEIDQSGMAKPRINRSGGGNAGGGKRGLNMPTLKKAIAAVQPYLDAGRQIDTRALAREAGVSHVMIDAAIGALSVAREMLTDAPPIDPTTLSLTAQQKLNTAIRQAQKRLDTEHAVRMMHVDEEVRQRVVDEGKIYRNTMQTREKKAKQTEATYRELFASKKLPLTVAEYNLLQRAIQANATDELRHKAHILLNDKNFVLTGRKPIVQT